MLYKVKYQWSFNTLDEDVGVMTGQLEKEISASRRREEAMKEIHQVLAKENPVSLRRSYTLLEMEPVSGKCPQCEDNLKYDHRDDAYCPRGCSIWI